MSCIDHTVYPDFSEPPETWGSPEAMADYVHRVCAAWDFHVLPGPETFELFSRWKEIFDRFPVLTSPAYHAFRAWFGWEPMKAAFFGPTPSYVHLDRLEHRAPDPCTSLV